MTLLLLPEFLQGDGLKVAVFVAFMAGFFALAKWASSRSESSANEHPLAPIAEPQYLETPTTAVTRVDAPMHPEMEYGDILIRGLNFKTFDAMEGPPDPTCFCDEIMMDLVNLAHGHSYTMTYVVATPDGLRKALDEKRWDIMYLPTVYVVKRYDLRLIRDTIMNVEQGGAETLEEILPPPREDVVDPLRGSGKN